ncbi:MAG: septum formation family protein [Actinomycetota bacterium]|nr:septum formation family protein [Actinomycetota bacterium]
MSIPRGRRRPTQLLAAGAVALLATSCFGSDDAMPRTAPSTQARAEGRTTTPSPSPTPQPPPEEDTCRRVSAEALRTIVNDDPAVPCARRHTVVTFHVGRVPAGARDALSAADAAVEVAADRKCSRRFRDYAGGTYADRRLSMLTPTYFLPSGEQWTLGARWVRCDAYAYATPTRLADLPRSLEDAFERDRVSDRLTRCSPVSPSAADFRHVACEEPHRWRAVATENVGNRDERYPGRGTVQDRARNRCEEPVREYLGTQESFSYGFEVPQRDAWSEGDRVALCWARTSE